ncbi:PilT domain-containing protein [Nitrospirillum viridazoti Y2]|uniref:Nucleic-acid-binding protein n=1 Tax=Nitrospirillum amazonense TaxID=28077 RepID=A0A560HWR2_9PROT|nr:type II toxin-antitoxin system VapC family toxin [Nitrospirillum amazonense]EGY01934.1 PilT domain-containing protein [Nitrospirillum amazonense Y2]TWB49484.1 putative nucleic-acid-binding protein [Nitrospirillum amazonense]
MRVAIDTNVLVRYLTWDDEAQAQKAAAVIEEAETLIIPLQVLCETAWVLKRLYRYGDQEIAAALRTVTDARSVQVNRPALETGLSLLGQGGDFADGVILAEADAAGADTLMTFDRTFASLSKATLL